MANEAPPTVEVPQTPGGVPTVNIPGTTIPVPIGSGVEQLIPTRPAFRNNAPPWYTPPGSVWSLLGCAVPQAGRYLHTNNEVIFDFVNVAGYSLFDTMWRFQDRKFVRFPSRDCLYQIHQLLVTSRSRLVAKTTPDNGSPLLASKATPAPKMFLVYPVPFYGPLGCQNQWLRLCAEISMLMMSEAMMHADNEQAYHITKRFLDVVYPYMKYLIVDMATKFFGETVEAASNDAYVITDAMWKAYDPTKFSVFVESTATRPPLGYAPTDIDLESVRGLPYQQVVPFLQPWPDSVLKYSTGGIWGNASSPAGDVVDGTQAGATMNVSLLRGNGPP